MLVVVLVVVVRARWWFTKSNRQQRRQAKAAKGFLRTLTHTAVGTLTEPQLGNFHIWKFYYYRAHWPVACGAAGIARRIATFNFSILLLQINRAFQYSAQESLLSLCKSRGRASECCLFQIGSKPKSAFGQLSANTHIFFSPLTEKQPADKPATLLFPLLTAALLLKAWLKDPGDYFSLLFSACISPSFGKLTGLPRGPARSS